MIRIWTAAAIVLCAVLAWLVASQTRQTHEYSDPIRIMALGDSITQGHTHSYRQPLWLALRAAGMQVDFVGSLDRTHAADGPAQDYDSDHEGHWGWRGDQVLERIDGWAQQAAPDVVLIHLGTNDLRMGKSPRQTTRDVLRIIDRLRAHNPRVHVLVASIIPVADGRATELFKQYNQELSALARRADLAGSRVFLVDQFTGFDPTLDTYDGVHPNERGSDKMAAKWFAGMQALLPDELPR